MAIIRSKLWYHPQWFAKYVPDPDIEGNRLQETFHPTPEPAPRPDPDPVPPAA
jgi:RND superfamily putative drug exporter